MFSAPPFEMEGDHVNINYRDTESWPTKSPKKSLQTVRMNLGDPEAGPGFTIANIRTLPEEPLNWREEVDPVHFHGTDQFRAVSDGGWSLAGREMKAADFSFQESGWTYQEHPAGENEGAWMMWVMGDRRGKPASVKRKIIETYDTPIYQGGEYPHPAGPKGIAAIATTLGPCDRGYLMGSVADLDVSEGSAGVSGLCGDEVAGPVIHVFKAAPGQTAIPSFVCNTELLLLVIAGDGKIGDHHYERGEVRVQRAGAPFPAVIAGDAGLQAVLVIADRRHRPGFGNEAGPSWMLKLDDLLADLKPTPGGPKQRSAAAAAS